MTSKRLSANNNGAVESAAARLQAGELIAFPTDTVYGVGANPFDELAIDRLYQAKGRSLEKGIPVLLADAADLPKVASTVPPVAHRLIARFWPGPLTLILPKRPGLPPNLTSDENIAVRVPDNEVARRFIRAAGGAVATTSANQSGAAPAENAAEAEAALGEWITIVLDGGPVVHGIASTIVDCTTSPIQILRPGPIDAAAIRLTAKESAWVA